MHRRSLLITALVLPLGHLPLPAFCKSRKRIFAPAGIALAGADPVAYFNEGRALPGKSDLALRWGGAIWCFSSEQNRDQFEMNPFAFMPQYGGHCALWMARGELRGSAPEFWRLEGSRLYMFSSAAAVQDWTADKAALLPLADANWAR